MVDKYIKELLIEHGRVYVPNLGLFYKDYNNNSPDQYTLVQPKSIYRIDEEYRNEDDTWLSYAVARGEHITLEDAENMVKDRVDQVKYRLEHSGSVEVEDLGTIHNNSGTLSFVVFESVLSETDNNFGIPERINVESEERDSYNSSSSDYTSSYDEPEYSSQDEYSSESHYVAPEDDNERDLYNSTINAYQEEPARKSKVGLIAAAVILFLIGFAALYILVLQPETSNDEDIADGNITIINEDTTKVAEASLNANSDKAEGPLPLSVPEAGKRYYIIAGAFTYNENAQKLKRQLKSKGVKAKILETKDSKSLYRVSLADFDNFDKALATTESLKTKHGNSIWILKY